MPTCPVFTRAKIKSRLGILVNFPVTLCISNNLIKHQSFVYTQLNDQTIQFSISTFFIYTQLNVKIVLFSTIQLTISTFLKAPDCFSVISGYLLG